MASNYLIRASTKVKFNPLTKGLFLDKKGFFVVVRKDTDKTLKIEKDAMLTLELLEKGHNVSETAKMVGRCEKEVITLVEQFVASDFVNSIDGTIIPDRSLKIKPFKFFLKQKNLQFLNSKLFWWIVLFFVLTGFIVALSSPEFFPDYRRYFWTDNLLLVYGSLFFLETIFVFLHELVHFVMTIAVGGQARVRISSRLLNIVAETESYHLALAEKSKRYLVYLSGMAFNLVIISAIIIYLKISPNFVSTSHVFRNLLIAIMLINIQSVIWQFNLFLQTDIYNFTADFLENDNLHNNAVFLILSSIKNIVEKKFLSLEKLTNKLKIFSRIKSNSDNFDFLDDSEKRHIFLYSVLFVLGLAFVTLQFAALTVPRDWNFVWESYKQINLNVRFNNYFEVIKALILISLVTWKYFVLVIIYLKKINNYAIAN